MNGDKSKYHAEIKLTLEGREVRINILSDILNEVFKDLGTICSQFQPEWKNPARQEVMNNVNALLNSHRGPQLTAGKGGMPTNASSQPKAKATPKTQLDQYFDDDEPETGEVPVCEACGSSETMELISFADKKTGDPRQAWKCQACNKWHWDNNNGRGR